MSGSPAGILEFFTGQKSADVQKESNQQAVNEQRYATDKAYQLQQEAVERFKPFYDVGVGAIPDYQKMLKGGYDMKESPAAQYQLQQGTKAMNRALASRGLSGSGNAAQRLTELNQSVAASDWNNQYSRILDALKLGTGASSAMGLASTSGANAAQAGAQNIGNLLQNSGRVTASLYQGMGQMAGNKGNDVYNAIKQYMNQNSGGGSGGGSGGDFQSSPNLTYQDADVMQYDAPAYY